jgi:hypothetical protein
MNCAKLRIVEVPTAVRAETKTHDVIEEALKESGFTTRFWNLFNSQCLSNLQALDAFGLETWNRINERQALRQFSRQKSLRHCRRYCQRTMADFGPVECWSGYASERQEPGQEPLFGVATQPDSRPYASFLSLTTRCTLSIVGALFFL